MNAPQEHIKKVAVLGLGPVGMMLAVHLKEAGFEVGVCDLDKIKINFIRKEGIRLEGAIQARAYFDHIYTDFSELLEFEPSAIFIAVKGYQAPAFVKAAMQLELGSTVFISAQNGIDVEHILVEGLGEQRVMRMVINFAGVQNTPNVVRVTFR